jgi:hypothetical protein
MTNNAPKLQWHSQMLASGTRRQRLYVDGAETPFFIDSANGIRAHKNQGDEHGLYGAGMHECEWRGQNGEKRYIAAALGTSVKVEPLKHRAEQMALAHA